MTTDPLVIRIIVGTRQSGHCKSCGAAITWAKTFPRQRNMPLDGDPVVLRTEHDAQLGAIDVIAASSSHFVTCPQADEHRSPRRTRSKDWKR